MTHPHPDDEQAAELTAFLDGHLPEDRRSAVQARLDADPALAAEVEHRRRAMRLIAAAVGETEAPFELRRRIDELGTARPARARRRWLPWGAGAGALAAVVLAVALFAGRGLTVPETVVAAVRPATAAALPDPREPRLLREASGGVRFPNFAEKFGWRATGSRKDEIEGRDTRTVFYEKDGRQVAYTIVAGEALERPEASTTTVDGIQLRTVRVRGRTVVTWERSGRTCVLSAIAVEPGELRELAAWRAKGAVRF